MLILLLQLLVCYSQNAMTPGVLSSFVYIYIFIFTQYTKKRLFGNRNCLRDDLVARVYYSP